MLFILVVLFFGKGYLLLLYMFKIVVLVLIGFNRFIDFWKEL